MKMKIRDLASVVSVALVILVCAAGCGDSSTGLRGQSAERAYAEALLPPAGALGEKWREIRRDLILRDGDEKSNGDFWSAEKALMRNANMPCRFCAAVLYADAASESAEATLAAVYFPERLYVLPLAEHDSLPHGFAANWLRGADGVAMASVDAEGGGQEGETGHEDASLTSAGDERAAAPVVSAPGFGEWGIDPVELLPEESAEDIARLLTAQPAVIYLAAQGLLVRIVPGKDLSRERLAEAIAGMRRHLAVRLHREKALREELARRRAAQRGEVVLEAQADPAAGVYWGLLEKAMGVIYRRRF